MLTFGDLSALEASVRPTQPLAMTRVAGTPSQTTLGCLLKGMIIPLTHVYFGGMMCSAEACDESLFSDAAVSHRKRCTGSLGQDALAEGRSLPGLQSRQVLADRVHQ